MVLSNNLRKAAWPTGLFLVLSLPQAYGQTNKLFRNDGNCPTFKTKLLHTLLFFIITYISIKSNNDKNLSDSVLIDQSIYATLVFFFLSSTEMYSLTKNLTGGIKLNSKLGESSCPTFTAVFIHTILFYLLISWIIAN